MSKLCFLVLCLLSFDALSWGKIGHRIVGEIAERELNSKAQKEIKKILGHESLSQVSNWPDLMKSNSSFDKYGSWHYVSVSDESSYSKSKKDPNGDIITALNHCEKILRAKTSTLVDKQFALKYLVHLAGDIHQPLHVGRKKDHGGNKIKLYWFGQRTNLHKIWDEDLIELQKLSYTEYTDYIYHVSPDQRKVWNETPALIWARESHSLRSQVYDFKAKKNWEWDYNYKNISTLNSRMLMAGVRLGGLLNNIYK